MSDKLVIELAPALYMVAGVFAGALIAIAVALFMIADKS